MSETTDLQNLIFKNKLYVTKGGSKQVIKITPKSHPKVFSFLIDNWESIIEEYQKIWKPYNEKLDKFKDDTIKMTVARIVSRPKENQLPKLELDYDSWVDLASEIGLKTEKGYITRKSFLGSTVREWDWKEMSKFTVSIASVRKKLVVIKLADQE